MNNIGYIWRDFTVEDIMRYNVGLPPKSALQPGIYVEQKPKPPKPEKIITCGPATIVFWDDKTKTIVKCSEGDHYDLYSAFCAAFAKKMYGTNSGLKKMIKKVVKTK